MMGMITEIKSYNGFIAKYLGMECEPMRCYVKRSLE